MNECIYETYLFRFTIHSANFTSFLKIAMELYNLKGIADE
jgi:hypothetical protein